LNAANRSLKSGLADFVLEDAAGHLVGIEVKAGVTVTERDFRGLEALAADAGKRFVRGVVLHAGREAIPFGRNLYALPLDALWRFGS
jgi:predicted AAA+ superfamily ATPase